MTKLPITLKSLAVATVAWLAFATPGHAQFATPEEGVKALYAMYAGKGAKGFPRDDAAAKRFFEPSLATLWLNAESIDADYFIDGQDFELGPVSVAPAAVKGDKATVMVQFTNFKKPRRMTYEMVKANDGWRIADVKHGKQTFRAMLKAS
jgi:hypothetical protein